MRGEHVESSAPATKSFGCRRCRDGLFCFFQTRFPHSSTLQVGGKAHFASKTIISPEVSGYSCTKVRGRPVGLTRGCSQCRTPRRWRCSRREHPELWTSCLPSHLRGISPRFNKHQRCVWKVPAPILLHERAFVFLDHRRSAIQPLSGWLDGALVPAARLHSTQPAQADRQDLHLRSSSTSACACAFRMCESRTSTDRVM